jgi:hypothetical protein
MDILTIILIVAAICGLVWVYPKLPQMAQIITAIVIVIACILVLLRFAGVPIGM